MKNNLEKNTTIKRKYNRPEITEIKLDNEISMVMASANPFNDPDSSIQPDQFSLNPFKMLKF
jgi:hypothetical protein